MTIVEFITARVDEDERVARAAGGREWHAIDLAEEGISIHDGEDDGDPAAGFSYHPPRNEQTRQITANSPAATLRRCAMVRSLAAAATAVLADNYSPDAGILATDTLADIAAYWNTHRDYRSEWEPVAP